MAPQQTPVTVYLDGTEIANRLDLRRSLAAVESRAEGRLMAIGINVVQGRPGDAVHARPPDRAAPSAPATT